MPHNQLVEQPWSEGKEREKLHARFANVKFPTKTMRMILTSKRRTLSEVSAFTTRKSIVVRVKSLSSAAANAYEFQEKDTTRDSKNIVPATIATLALTAFWSGGR